MHVLGIICMLVASAQDLQPRVPQPKEAVLVPAIQVELAPQVDQQHRLVVKFIDAVQARSVDGALQSKTGRSLQAAQSLADSFTATFRPLIAMSEPSLRSLQQRAARHSSRAQPDLAGIQVVEVKDPRAEVLELLGAAFLRLPNVEYAHIQVLGVTPPGDIQPTTPDLVVHQDYRQANPGMNVDYAWTQGATGNGIRLSDCEYGWVTTHEDLNDLNTHPEAGQTVDPGVVANGWDEHGTAVLGETSAVVNSYGCSGMVPDAEVHTYPEWTVQQGFRRVTAITRAITNSSAGDVVLLEMQTSAGAPAEVDQSVWTVVKTGTDAGVLVVGAAGNGDQNLNSPGYAGYRSRGDSGALIVGAGSSNASHSKLSFSSYGDRVNVQGWGGSVFTLGYGSFAQYGGDKNQRYTASFGGTSSASPFVASACVAIQSYALAHLGTVLSPLAMRQLLTTTGIPQGGSGGNIGPLPDLQAALQGLNQSLPSGGLLLSTKTDETIGSLTFEDEDILHLDLVSGILSLVLDLSDVIPTHIDVDAFALLDDGSFLVSFNNTEEIPGLLNGPGGETIQDEDLARFIPASVGSTTLGVFEFYFDGSDVGLDRSNDNEDINGVTVDETGALLITVRGNFKVNGNITGRDEDVLRFEPTALGEATAGTWSLFWDGNASGSRLGQPGEGLDALHYTPRLLGPSGPHAFPWQRTNQPQLTVSTKGHFDVPGAPVLSGEDYDLLRYTAWRFGSQPLGHWQQVLEGASYSILADIDGVSCLE